jgi:hypothetical protein
MKIPSCSQDRSALGVGPHFFGHFRSSAAPQLVAAVSIETFGIEWHDNLNLKKEENLDVVRKQAKLS